jgi:rhodanese-related sulfurtransferase
MSVERISPEEAQRRVEEDGYTYLDVRSVPEFEAGHPTGAYNVPIMHAGPQGMRPNPDFLEVVVACFPKDAKLVLGCKAGGRSLKAAQALVQAGYTEILDQKAGFDGARDAFGQLVEPGWSRKGLPVSMDAEDGHAWAALAARAGKSA